MAATQPPRAITTRRVESGIPPHPHLALVEIIGGLPGGQYHGVDLCQFFLDSADSDTVSTVTFNQDGSPPVVSG